MKWLKRLLGSEDRGDERGPIGRNDPCWCGSGAKYKRCHLESDLAKARARAVTPCASS